MAHGADGVDFTAAVDRLCKQLATLQVALESRVFVPYAQELALLWLQPRHAVIGVETIALAVESFCMEHGIPARRRVLSGFECTKPTASRLFCAIFSKN